RDGESAAILGRASAAGAWFDSWSAGLSGADDEEDTRWDGNGRSLPARRGVRNAIPPEAACRRAPGGLAGFLRLSGTTDGSPEFLVRRGSAGAPRRRRPRAGDTLPAPPAAAPPTPGGCARPPASRR